MHIDIGGRKRPVRLAISTITRIEAEDEHLRSFDAIASSGRIIDVVSILFQALKTGAKKKKEPFEYTIDDLMEWIDDDGIESFAGHLEKIVEHDMPTDSANDDPADEISEDPTMPATSI